MVTPTKEVSANKLAHQDKLVSEMEKELGLAADHPEDDEVLLLSPEDIVANLKAKKSGWTSERVTIAFIRAACAAHRKTNCLTEVLFREALADARAQDAAFKASGKAEGAFWGLPSSFKDTYNIKGTDTSLGCSIHCYDPTTEEADEGGLVKLFRKGGGFPYAKTNIPQTLLAFECSNPVFGTSTNPYSSARTPGGSSGGEAALVTLRGTPLGWGSDIGGSLRIPAAYSGCVGLKPTVGRWPAAGTRKIIQGFDGIKPVVGPMARTVAEIEFASRAMINLVNEEIAEGKFLAEYVIPLPWREAKLAPKLKIGYWVDDGLVKTSPACARAVHESVAKLRELGHDVSEFRPPIPIWQALKIFSALSSAEGYKQLLGNLGPDPMEPSMQLVTLGTRLPSFVTSLAATIVRLLLKDQLFGEIMSASKPKSAAEYWDWTAARNDYIEAFYKAAWEEEQYDFILSPVQAVPALEHGRTKELSPLAIHTIFYNVLDSTVGVVPITRVDPDKDAAPADYTAGSTGSWLLEKRVYGGDDPAYDATKMAGLPVAVQVAGRRWDEERVIAFMRVLEDNMGYK
ncbi:Fatty acid amide hydrolase 1 [Vanrija pseudolonga]|uniref:amidase n=1 Tax=Vanrija pseudolonga TaxID=143232 RepID=A0AAF0YCN9_9TREE|nr:Fatty acid amide hydrolase 1 [Vanrija pseudolonga]